MLDPIVTFAVIVAVLAQEEPLHVLALPLGLARPHDVHDQVHEAGQRDGDERDAQEDERVQELLALQHVLAHDS